MAHNVTHEVKAGKLIITIDISAKALAAAKPSATGKTNLIASTSGAVGIDNVPGGSFSLNVMQKNN